MFKKIKRWLYQFCGWMSKPKDLLEDDGKCYLIEKVYSEFYIEQEQSFIGVWRDKRIGGERVLKKIGLGEEPNP